VSDFAAMNFDVLNSYFGSIFKKKKTMENLLTNLKTKKKIAEKRKTTEETESKPSDPKL
jgi:cobyric acid synthase